MTQGTDDGVTAMDPADRWGPEVAGGRAWRLVRRVVSTLVVATLVGLAAVTTTGLLLLQQAEASLTRVAVPELEETVAPSDARHFLLVGTDSREGLGADARSEHSLGDFGGQRADVIIYVTISEDRSVVSLVSLPRDLLVMDGERRVKLANTFAGGPDNLVRVIRENFGLPVHHFAQISLSGFLDVVETLGSVTVDLREPLVDRKSGANFPEAGPTEMDAQQALSFVRSRDGDRVDFERIDRQQRFIRAVLDELLERGVLTNPIQLSQLIDDVASSVTTDEDLGLAEMRAIADEARQVVRDGIPMATVPAYPRHIDRQDFMIAYRPGAEAMFADLVGGRPLRDIGSRDDRAATSVALYSGGRNEAGRNIASVLFFAGFRPNTVGRGTESIDAGSTTVVFSLPGHDDQAGWVAAVLGAEIRPLPADVEPPEGAHVVVSAGDDAAD